jgi:PAS domain S-box-containing protein
MTRAIRPTGVENLLGEEELIVSKTDLKGRITYANDVFIRMAKYSYAELMGAPHSLIRHPDMPRSVFKLLWDTLQAKQEIFAYVVNLAKDGSHYWVFAHVTPTFDERGTIVGYHSNRRKPDPAQIEPGGSARSRSRSTTCSTSPMPSCARPRRRWTMPAAASTFERSSRAVCPARSVVRPS